MGVEALVLVELKKARWRPDEATVTTGTCGVPAAPSCVTDGLREAALFVHAGSLVVILLTGVSARYTF